MARKIIAVDIDEVLMPHFQDLIDWYNQKHGTQLTLHNNHPKTPEGWGTDSFEEAVKRVQKFLYTEKFKNSQPFEEAKRAVKHLSQNHTMVVITSRDNIIEEMTRRWLDTHFPELFEDAHFTGLYNLEGQSRSKAEVARSINADYLIDDSLDHIKAASKAGIIGLLFGDYPWNQIDKLPKRATRVKNWQEVLEYFDGQE